MAIRYDRPCCVKAKVLRVYHSILTTGTDVYRKTLNSGMGPIKQTKLKLFGDMCRMKDERLMKIVICVAYRGVGKAVSSDRCFAC